MKRAFARWIGWVLGLLLMTGGQGLAQIDPEYRELVQLGYNQPLQGRGPLAAYLYYYRNQPGFPTTNQTVRLALAPTYLDSEIGLHGFLTEHTDLAFGVAGGGFADSYSEVRMGQLLRSESFIGHGAEVNMSIYHYFNPTPDGSEPDSLAEVPLQAIVRSSARYSAYDTDSKTAENFLVPEDKIAYHLRLGLRWGGREPLIEPPVAVELSTWYEGQFRTRAQDFGFDFDREIASQTHLIWSRALAAYTFEDRQRVEVSLTGGTSINSDRISAYRLGGALPMVAEFPLMIPGYYYQELSAGRFALLAGNYSFRLGAGWEAVAFGSVATVRYLWGLDQPGNWHSGLGGGLGWTSPGGAWHVLVGYAYGFDAIRSEGRGAQNIGITLQWDVERGGKPPVPEFKKIRQWLSPDTWRGFDRIFRR